MVSCCGTRARTPSDRDIEFAELRAKRTTRARSQRPVPDKHALETFFRLPIFTGCKDWEKIHTPGNEIYHRAGYFGPMLAYYHGLRREEFCGLAIDDVVTDNGPHPYIHVTFNEVRRIKNDQSVRNITLHPELVRLNFLDYVDAIRALGEIRLFPDLYSPSTRSPLGDRLYDELLPAYRTAKFTTHQIRHSFNNELKQKRVSEEFRADLMGHAGKSETSERYCDPLLIDVQVEELAHLPVLTAHLAAVPVRLVPWVARREVAPWARARRKVGR